MFNPLLGDIQNLSVEELELKISELTRKYFIAARSGNSGLAQQVLVAVEGYRQELSSKHAAANKVATRNGDKNFDDLIHVNK
jgi:hypothetical protein